MKENRILWIGDAVFVIFFLMVASPAAFTNIIRSNVPHPERFLVAAAGFLFFAIAKVSVLKGETLFSIETRGMTQTMANLYRLGYWLMLVGCLFTFMK